MAEARSELQDAVRAVADEFFAGEIDRAALDASEGGCFSVQLWEQIVELGLPMAACAEERGGLGSLRDACVLLRPLGYHAAPLPLAEALLAGWLAERCGLGLPSGVSTFTIADIGLAREGSGWRATGALENVPWGRNAATIAVATQHEGRSCLALIAAEGADIVEAANIAAEPRDRILCSGAQAQVAPLEIGLEQVAAIAATMRAAQMAGALERILDLTVSYAKERVQFGKPIGKFQAIQQQCAILANHTAASIMAVERAIDLVEQPGVLRMGAIAKVRTGEAACEGARIAHQVHGAMGFTHEHILHHLTRRLWAWRDERGSEAHWARRLGAEALAGGAEALWDYVGEAS